MGPFTAGCKARGDFALPVTRALLALANKIFFLINYYVGR